METLALRRLHYAAAVACGVFAALALHIVLSVFGVGLDQVLRAGVTGSRVQVVSALAWWAVSAAGFLVAWGAASYLIAAARERARLTRLAQRVLIAIVFLVALTGGVMSKQGAGAGTAGVIAGLTALGIGLICAYCGARLAYLNTEQI